MQDERVAHVRFWKVSEFSRGVLAAGGLLGASATILPYAALDLVSGLHAVLVGWRALAEAIGDFVGPLFNLPKIPPTIVSAAMVGSAIGPPWAYSILRSEWGQHKGFIQNAAYSYRVVIALIEAFFWSFVLVSVPFGLIFLLASFSLTLSLLGALRRLPTFRSGFFTALGFLALMEGVYLASTPKVQTAFDSFVCKHAGDTAPRCQVK